LGSHLLLVKPSSSVFGYFIKREDRRAGFARAPFAFGCGRWRSAGEHWTPRWPGAEKARADRKVFHPIALPLGLPVGLGGLAAMVLIDVSSRSGGVQRLNAQVGAPGIARRWFSRRCSTRTQALACTVRTSRRSICRPCRPIGWCSHSSPAAVRHGSAIAANRALSSVDGRLRSGRVSPSRSYSTKAETPSQGYALAASRVLTPAIACLSPDGPDPSETGARRAPWPGANARNPDDAQLAQRTPRNLRWRASPAGPALQRCFLPFAFDSYLEHARLIRVER